MYTYDQLERCTATAINGVSSSVIYDSLGRVTNATNPLGSFTYGYYGVTPRLQTVTYPNGQSSSYSYLDNLHDFRLSEIKNLTPSSAVLSQGDYTYNAVGTIATLQQQIDANTPTIWNYKYDGADQLLSAVKTNTSTQAVLAQYFYGYDLGGNRKTEQIGLGVNTSSYNNLNQLTGRSAGGPLQFTGTLNKPATVTVAGNAAAVDANNNFSGTTTVSTGTNTVPVVATNLNGYAATNKYQVVVPVNTAITPAYDLNGNQTNNGAGQTYAWDAKDELTQITYTGGATTNFTYDGRGRRVSIIEKNSGGTVTSTKQFVWLGSSMAEERDASNTVQKRFFAQGEQIGANNYFYTRDHLGSVREMTDSSGTIQARYEYDPYGRVTKIQGSLDSDKQYAGMYIHLPSGLNVTKYRFYDPNTAKWLSRDPIAERGGINLYAYADNNPINETDPSGEFSLTEAGISLIIIIVIAVVLTAFLEQQLKLHPIYFPSSSQPTQPSAPSSTKPATTQPATCPSNTATPPNPLLPGPTPPTNKQVKKLSPGEIKILQDNNIDPHDLKPNSQYDLFKDQDGNIEVRPKNGDGPGDPTGHNINDYA